MLVNASDILDKENVMKEKIDISVEHVKVAYRAKMSNYEILLCQQISSLGHFPLIDVMEKMEAFKQTSEHLLYKKDFMFI